MHELIVHHAGAIRGGAFFALLALWLALERWHPRRVEDFQRRLRWPANFGLVAAGALLSMAVPFAALGLALRAQAQGWGLLALLHAPQWLAVTLAWTALDAAIYWQHRLMHRVAWLWPLHRVHHSDIAIDATTALRFHPAEILLSLLYKCGVVLLLGAPALAVLLFEIGLNGAAMFNHANLRLPPAWERGLRKILVTPDMHRVHHSVHRAEHDSNYGFALSCWDRWFGSYIASPRDGQQTMRIGLPRFRDAREQTLAQLLVQPARPR